jgi:hypothetical protein
MQQLHGYRYKELSELLECSCNLRRLSNATSNELASDGQAGHSSDCAVVFR